MIEPAVLMYSLISNEFIKFISKYINGIRKARGKKRVEEAQKTLNATIEHLSEKQAEAITFEHIYVNLLDGKIDNKQAIEIISSLGYKINPSPIQWLKEKLARLREWIIDAVKLLKKIGEELRLKVKEITLELGLSPKVSISFVPTEQ